MGEYWKVGCLGLTEPCTATCEASFLDCVASQGATTYLENTEAFETCIDSSKFKNLDVALIHVLLHMECWSQVRSQKLLPLTTLELAPKKQLTSQLKACAHNN